MATREPCRVILHPMGITNASFPLTVAKAPFTDVRCQTSLPARRKSSSSVVRLLKNRIQRAGRTLSPPKSSAPKELALEVDPLIASVVGGRGERTSVDGPNSITESTQTVQRTISRTEAPQSQICRDSDECTATQSVDLEGWCSAPSGLFSIVKALRIAI